MIKLLRSWTGQILTRIYITSFQSEWKNMTNSPTDFKLPPVIDVVPVPAISRSGALTRIKMKAAFMAINMMSVQCRSARNILTDSSLLGDGDLECWGKKWKAQKYELPLWICHQIRLLFPKYAHRTIPPVTPYPSGWTGSNRTAALLIASVSRRCTVNSFLFQSTLRCVKSNDPFACALWNYPIRTILPADLPVALVVTWYYNSKSGVIAV